MPPKLTLTEAFLKESLAENRRLCGEVRRYRRALRGIHYSVSEPRGMAPVLVIMDGIKAACDAALAPRRRKK